MRLAIFTKYESLGANSRYRTLQFIPYLRANGVSVDAGHFFSDQYLRRRYAKKHLFIHICTAILRRLFQCIRFWRHDVWLVEYELIPFAPPFLEAVCQFLGKKIVSDYDDAIFHRYDNHRSIVVRFFFERKIATVGKFSKLVICGNSYLASYFKNNHVKDIKILPTVVDVPVISKSSDGRKKVPGSALRIGWIGSPSTEKYLNLLRPSLNVLKEKIKIEVWLCGASERCLIDQNPIYVPWSIEEEGNFLRAIDIGVMPLTEDQWSQGKCGLKLIQYGAHSVPALASPVGVNKVIVDDSVTGFLCSSMEDWVEGVLKLVDDDRRAEMGAAALDRVTKHYSLRVSAPQLLTSLKVVYES